MRCMTQSFSSVKNEMHDPKLGGSLTNNIWACAQMPVYSIASATGFDRSIVVEKLLEQDNRDLVYDPATGIFLR